MVTYAIERDDGQHKTMPPLLVAESVRKTVMGVLEDTVGAVREHNGVAPMVAVSRLAAVFTPDMFTSEEREALQQLSSGGRSINSGGVQHVLHSTELDDKALDKETVETLDALQKRARLFSVITIACDPYHVFESIVLIDAQWNLIKTETTPRFAQRARPAEDELSLLIEDELYQFVTSPEEVAEFEARISGPTQ